MHGKYSMTMKKIIIAAAVILFSASGLSAQKLVIGEKAPDIKASEWIIPQSGRGTATLTEFFFSQSDPSVRRLPALDGIARQNAGKLAVIVISREDKSKVEPFVSGKNYSFGVAIDDNGKTFASYGVQFVPFSVLTDARGRVVWFGNSSQLTNNIIQQAF